MKKNIIVIFNKNYCHFKCDLTTSLEKNNVFNNKKYHVIFCDDGSSDDSFNRWSEYKDKNKIINLEVLRVSPFNTNREFYSHGQIHGLKMALDFLDKENIDVELFFLLDSDDYFSDCYLEKVGILHGKLGKSLYFNQIYNFNSSGERTKSIKARKVDNVQGIWPSVILTSGICFSSKIVEIFSEAIFDLKYRDVWLDSRINTLSMLIPSEVEYTEEIVYRRLHGSNDSRNVNIFRKIKKQLEIADYFNRHVLSKRKFRFNLRVFVLILLNKAFSKK